MPPPPLQHSRINLADLKSQIAKRLGAERANCYFSHLNRLLSQKLSKSEFDKLCFATLGRENIPLHNQLILSILKNACQAKAPPPAVHDKDTLKPIRAIRKKSSPTDDGFHPSPDLVSAPPIWSNGDILPPSPRKSRSAIRDRRLKDRPSPLGPNGKTDVIPHQSLVPSDEAIIRENGDLVACDLKRPVQHQQAVLAEPPTKKQRTERSSPHDRVSAHSKAPVEVVVVEDGEEVGQSADASSSRGPLRAPLGIPFCPASVGGARRPLPTSTSSGCFTSNYYSSELCHTEALRKRMEQIAEAQGLGGVTMDCANLLNNSLDTYLKRLIRSCVELVGSRSGQEPINHLVFKQQPHGKIINGIWPGNHIRVQSSSGPLECTQDPKNHSPISLLDFKVAMELNPHQLGEDWPLLLEKVCLRSFEE